MNLIKKIKFNYHLKLISDHITNKNFHQASDEIRRLKNSDPSVYFFVLKSLNDYLNDTTNIDLHEKKIIWTVSYDLDDQIYINNFLKFYLKKNYHDNFYSNNFAESLSEYLSSFKGHDSPKEITFNEMIKNSGFFQNLLLFKRHENLFIFDTSAAFFETDSKHYFIYQNTTLCYFYVVRDLKDLFIKYKTKLGTTEEAYNELFNYTGKNYLSDILKQKTFKVYENKTNYNTNINSWSDPNVLSTYKGKLISFEELVEKTEEVLVDIIQHLKQYYPNLKVNYQTISEFVGDNKLFKDQVQEISKSENKFLKRNVNIKNLNTKEL